MMETYIFDIRARVDSDHIAVLDSEVVANDPIYASAAVIEVVISKNDQNGVFSLLALNKDCVTTEELERLHGVVGKRNDRVIIVYCVRDAGGTLVAIPARKVGQNSHQRVWLLLFLQDCGGCLILR